MASVVITITRSGHETIITEESDDVWMHGDDEPIETPTAHLLLAQAVARACRAEKIDITRLTERLVALSQERST